MNYVENEKNIVKMKNSLTEQLRIAANIMTTSVDIFFALSYYNTSSMYEVKYTFRVTRM